MLAETLVFPAKSPEAFRTITEVADELGVPQHVLRFWETRFPHVRPVKRAGGRRYYRPEDVDLLRGIKALLYAEGFTIKGAQKVLRERGARHVASLGRPPQDWPDERVSPEEPAAPPPVAEQAPPAGADDDREQRAESAARRARLFAHLEALSALKARLGTA